MKQLPFPLHLCLTLCLLASTVHAVEKSDIASAVKLAATKPHPRLILTKELEKKLREQLAEDKDMRKCFEIIKTDADSLLKKPPRKRIMQGHRLLRVSRTVLERVCLRNAHRLLADQNNMGEACKMELRTVDGKKYLIVENGNFEEGDRDREGNLIENWHCGYDVYSLPGKG